jgi:hypothetical protein
MAMPEVSHHERVDGHPHRWHVHLRGRTRPVVVELPAAERAELDLTDAEIHELLPTALERHAAERDVNWDAPVRVLQTHFMG